MHGYVCRLVVREVEARGFDPGPVLTGLRLDRDAIEAVPPNRALACLRTFSRLTRDPDLGLAAGQQARVADFPLPGLLLRSSPNLAAAHSAANRYATVWGPRQVLAELDGEELVTWLVVPPRTPRLLSDAYLAAVTTIVHSIVGSATLRQVRLRHRRPDDVSGYLKVFGLVPEFGAGEYSLTHSCRPTEPLPFADELIADALEPLVVEQSRAVQPHRLRVADHVRAAITEQLADGPPTIGRVARQLATSDRTLRRRLRDEGATFSELLDDARREMALDLVADSRSTVREIAAALGYTDPATLSRAFQRWTGTTMTAWRSGS
jgi:AraC-like DNA-binding protein